MSLCGECDSNRVTTCEQSGADCDLRFLYCLRPHGSPLSDVPLPPQAPLTSTDSFTFQEGFIVQSTSTEDNFWNRSNPFTRKLQLWPGRAQLYIVVYSFNNINPSIVDRLLIDLELNILSDFTERSTYHGRQNVSQFDLSFRVDGQCSGNYYGPQCNVFCSGVEGQFTCDSEGNMVCVNSNRSPVSSSMYGVIGGLSGCVAVLCIVSSAVVICLLCRKKNEGMHMVTRAGMTQNLIHGRQEAAVHITMEENVGYGVAHGDSIQGSYV